MKQLKAIEAWKTTKIRNYNCKTELKIRNESSRQTKSSSWTWNAHQRQDIPSWRWKRAINLQTQCNKFGKFTTTTTATNGKRQTDSNTAKWNYKATGTKGRAEATLNKSSAHDKAKARVAMCQTEKRKRKKQKNRQTTTKRNFLNNCRSSVQKSEWNNKNTN